MVDSDAKIQALLEFLKEQERLEAMMLEDDSPIFDFTSTWFDNVPEAIYQQMMDVQNLRNKAKSLCNEPL
jgi:hypothetical protein